MIRGALVTSAVIFAFATVSLASITPGIVFHEDFADGQRVDRDDPSMPNWYSVRTDLQIRGGQNRLDTWFDTAVHVIGAQFSDTPLSLSRDFELQLTVDYNPRTDDTPRTHYVMFGLYGGEPISGDGFTPWNRAPETGDTADWVGYQVRQIEDGGDATSGIYHSAPGPDGEGDIVGSIHWHNNTQIGDEAPGRVAPVVGWDSDLEDFPLSRSARLSLYLDEDDNVVTEYWWGEDRDSLELITSGVDDREERVTGGFEHIGLAVRGTPHHPRVLFDNLTVEYVGDVELLVGDMNADGVVDTGDVAPFVLALTDPAAYMTQFGVDEATMIAAGDINGDGAFDTGDVAPFVQLLVGDGQAASVPEPASLTILGVGGLMLLRRRRRSA